MAVKTTCPDCGAAYNLSDDVRGKRVRCKKCNETFVVGEDVLEAEPEQEQLQAGRALRARPLPPRPRLDDDEEEDAEEPPRRPRRRPVRQSGSNGLLIGLIVGGAVVIVGLLVVLVLVIWYRAGEANVPQPLNPQLANVPPQNVPPPVNNQQAPVAPQAVIPVTDKPIILFNGKVSRDFPRPGLHFSVEYKFQRGSATPGQFYFWVIEPEQGDGYEVRMNWTEMGKEDTLKARSFMPGFGTRGPYTMYIQAAQTPSSLNRRGRETISNKLVVDVPAGANVPGMPGAPGAGRGGAPPGPAPVVERKPLEDAELTALLGDLGSGDTHRIQLACARLNSAVPEKRREEVARALEKLLSHADMFNRQAAARTLANWGTKESVPALIKAADDSEFAVRWAVLDALVPFKDARAAAKLAEHLVDNGDRIHSSKALKEIGSAAEKEVAKYLTHQEWLVRLEACNILKEIGTRQSLPALQAQQQDSNGLVKMAANEAAKACSRR